MAVTHLAFDMDGVMYSAEDFIADAYREAIIESGLNLPVPAAHQIMEQIGKPIWEIYSNLFPLITRPIMMELRKYTRKWVVQMVSEKRGKIYEGIPDLLDTLFRNYTLAVCSNGGPGYVGTILKTYDLDKYFIPVLTLDSENLNDKTALLGAYISKYSHNASSWVMIGDRKTDLEAALNNNCRFIGCTWGHIYIGELAGTDFIIKSPAELIGLLSEINES